VSAAPAATLSDTHIRGSGVRIDYGNVIEAVLGMTAEDNTHLHVCSPDFFGGRPHAILRSRQKRHASS
jgi:hypothetical protein